MDIQAYRQAMETSPHPDASHVPPEVARLGDVYPFYAPQEGQEAFTDRRDIVPEYQQDLADQHDIIAPDRRRYVLGSLLALGAGAAGAAAVNAWYPLAGLACDVSSPTGERRLFTLDEGSSLLLDARSRVDLSYSLAERVLNLLDGAVLLTTVSSHGPPLAVRTAEGRIRPLGTQVMVRQQGHRTLVVAQQGSAEIETISGAHAILPAGTGTRFDAARIGAPRAELMAEAAWKDGLIQANGRPLVEIVAALRPYRAGQLRMSTVAGGLPVRGDYPLDDTDATLLALAARMPIRVRRLTPWFVSIDVISPTKTA
jgi:transmembrane sensor